jgi:hypothetical protein
MEMFTTPSGGRFTAVAIKYGKKALVFDPTKVVKEGMRVLKIKTSRAAPPFFDDEAHSGPRGSQNKRCCALEQSE